MYLLSAASPGMCVFDMTAQKCTADTLLIAVLFTLQTCETADGHFLVA